MDETAAYVIDRDDWFYDEFFGEDAVQTRKDAILHHKLMRASYPGAAAESLTSAYYAGAMEWLHAAAAYLKAHGSMDGWTSNVSLLSKYGADPNDDIETLKARNRRIMCSLWYHWFFFNEGISTGQRGLRHVLVSSARLAKRQTKREKARQQKDAEVQRIKDNEAKYNAIKEECEREIKAADESMAHVPPSSDPMAYSQASKRATDIYVAAMKRSSSAFYELILGRAPPPLEMPSN